MGNGDRRGCRFRTVGYVHDELIIETDRRLYGSECPSLEDVCREMAKVPPWAPGLLLRADGYECDFYRKE